MSYETKRKEKEREKVIEIIGKRLQPTSVENVVETRTQSKLLEKADKNENLRERKKLYIIVFMCIFYETSYNSDEKYAY